MRHLLFALVFCFVPWLVQAQVSDLLHKMSIDSTKVGNKVIAADSIWTEHYLKCKYDTNYIQRPEQPFLVRARANFSGSSISVKGFYNEQPLESRQHTPSHITVSLGVAYRGLALSFSVNPAKWKGTSHSSELNIRSYGNRYGFEASYQDNKLYTGWSRMNGVYSEISQDIITTRILNMSAYYVFNRRKFSYPAALSQSYIQRRSAGSWMLAASLMWGELKASPWGNLRAFSLRLGNVGLGGGYGYNWVVSKHWLLHASALPTIVVGSFNKLKVGDDEHHVHYTFPEFILTARAAAVYQFHKKHFASLTYVQYHTLHGSSRKLRLIHQKWRLSVTYGVRF